MARPHVDAEPLAVAVSGDVKSAHFGSSLRRRVLAEVILMTGIKVDRSEPVPSISPADVPDLSDDECLARLSRAVAKPDSAQLDEVAALIGRLAVALE